MKYLLITALAMAALFGLGLLLVFLAQRVTRRDWSGRTRLVVAAALGTMMFSCVVAIYLGIYYHAGQTAQRALDGSSNVSVTSIDQGYLFDGPGEHTAVVFLPGAKVAAEAYVPLMLDIASGGADCVLIDPPAHFAFLAGGALDNTFANYRHDHWVLAGHSLGGVVASSYAASHPHLADGLALLASYPTEKLKDDLVAFTIYGSRDGVLDQLALKKASSLLPSRTKEVCIAGGNHANFGDYGTQQGDQTASIDPRTQWDETASAIRELVQEVEAK